MRFLVCGWGAILTLMHGDDRGRTLRSAAQRSLKLLVQSKMQVPDDGHHGFLLQEYGTEGDQWHRLFYEADKVDDPRAGRGPMSTFDFCCGLLVPLYAARATELILFGREGATLATAKEVRCEVTHPRHHAADSAVRFEIHHTAAAPLARTS